MIYLKIDKDSGRIEVASNTKDNFQYDVSIDAAQYSSIKYKFWYNDQWNTTAKNANWKITRLAFRNRFTPEEKIALYTAAESNIAIKVYLDDVNAATFIDLQRPDTIAGVQALELATVIAGGRAATILTTPPSADEEYR